MNQGQPIVGHLVEGHQPRVQGREAGDEGAHRHRMGGLRKLYLPRRLAQDQSSRVEYRAGLLIRFTRIAPHDRVTPVAQRLQVVENYRAVASLGAINVSAVATRPACRLAALQRDGVVAAPGRDLRRWLSCWRLRLLLRWRLL